MAVRTVGFQSVLAVREFRALWLAELQSVLGDQLARVALSVLVFQRTGSAAWPALTYALTYLPDLVGGPLLGGFADRFPRRAVLVTADLLRAALVAVLAIPGLPLAALAAVLVVVQLANAPFAAAQAAVVPAMLEGERYPVGQSLLKMTNQAGQLAGFAGGGAIVAVLGPGRGLVIDALTFGISAALLRWGIRTRPAAGRSRGTGTFRRLAAGARTIWRDARLRTLVGLAWLAGFVIVPEGLAVPYAAEIGGGAAAAGLLLAAHPAGILAGVYLLGRWVPAQVRLRMVGLLAVGAIVPLIGYAFRPGLGLTIGLLLVSGACAGYQVTASTTFMRLVPDAERGQAFGLAGSGLIAVQGLGLLAGGLLVGLLRSPALTVAVVAATGLVAAVPGLVAWRRIRASITP